MSIEHGVPGFVDIVFVRIPYEDGQVSIDGRTISITRRTQTTRPADRPRSSPQTQQRVTPVEDPETGRLGGGRDMSELLFVTHAEKLAKNIGRQEAESALRTITAGAQCIRIDTESQPESAVRHELAKGKHRGVVLVGGYDVVPSQRVDVLDPALRAAVPRRGIIEDRDEFIVWSDDTWADIDGVEMSRPAGQSHPRWTLSPSSS